jgi:hypothetical protein
MFSGKSSRLVIVVVAFAVIGGSTTHLGQAAPAKSPSPEAVAKLIAQLGDADFRTREQATRELERLGTTVLPALRKAARTNPELEVKSRLEHLIVQIEKGPLKSEEKHWQEFDAPRRGIKDRLVAILARAPALTDQQVASAVYLLTVSRPPTDDEMARARKQFTDLGGRLVPALRLARSLVQAKEFNVAVAAANDRLSRVRKDLAAGANVAERLHRLNGAEFQKMSDEIAASLNKAVKTDEQFVNLAFLLTLSRFPDAKQSTVAITHLKNTKDRAIATANIIWSLTNTKEFLTASR